MPDNPVRAAGQGPIKATLEILEPKVDNPIIPLRFNPTEYQLQKTNNFAEIPIPGLEAPPLQFIRGAAEKLSLELLVDTSDTLEDVREKYTDRLRALLNIKEFGSKQHAPPIVRFNWNRQVFRGVVESLNITYTLFTQDGIPLRAKLQMVLKEYRPAEVQAKEMKKESPNVEKAYTVKRGDTLSSISGDVYRDPAQWRVLARANGIQDPRDLQPGTVLSVPRLI